tara:strand:- start:1299 stop:2156 length:858 start_codon:yes stop_codon:yes gene_type:complete
MFKRKECSPLEQNNGYSCLDDDLIIDIAKIFNEKMNAKIDLNNTPKEIHEKLSSTIQKLTNEKSESVLLDMHKIINALPKNKLKRFKNSFRPEKPEEWHKNFNEWLSTTDIDVVLKQYAEADSHFYYYGATPMDFDLKNGNKCSVNGLCKFDLGEHLNNGIEKIGVVFNTDDHDEPGEHWVSMYVDCKGINLNEPCIYYFDSTGDDAPEEVKSLIEKIKDQGLEKGIKFTDLHNDLEHQKGNSECGMYCLHFMIYMLEDGNFMKYVKNKKSDEYIEKFRNVFFID